MVKNEERQINEFMSDSLDYGDNVCIHCQSLDDWCECSQRDINKACKVYKEANNLKS